MIRKTTILTLAAFALTISLAHARSDSVRLVLDYAIQGQQSPFVLAADNGYFKKAGATVTVDRGAGSGDAVTKVASGAYDMAFADIGALIQFRAMNPGTDVISVFQVYNVAPMVVLSLRSSNITKPVDLVGKSMASPATASSRIMFPVFAAANGFDPASIKWIDVTAQLREAMLTLKRADATTALITDLAGLGGLGLTQEQISIMRYSDYGVDLYGHVILTSRKFATEHPDLVRSVITGYVAALKATIANPDIAIAAMKARDPLVNEATERLRLDLVLSNAILTDAVKTNGLGAVDPARMQKTVDAVVTSFRLPKVKTADVYDGSFLPSRKELLLN